MNKTKKDLRKERLETFRTNVLPEIQKIYKVSSHGPNNAPNTMYKIIIHSNLSYDYYPMSEKVRRAKYSLDINNTEYKWSEVKLEHLVENLKKLKNIK